MLPSTGARLSFVTVKVTVSLALRGFVASSSVAANVMVSLPIQVTETGVTVAIRLTILTVRFVFPDRTQGYVCIGSFNISHIVIQLIV
jgi:hypothetical protein